MEHGDLRIVKTYAFPSVPRGTFLNRVKVACALGAEHFFIITQIN